MKWNKYIFSVILLLFNFELVYNQACQRREARLKFITRGKYKNVLNYNMGALISSKVINGFSGGNQGSCYRDTIYTITGGYGFTASALGNSIIFDLQEQYQLNTLKIWFWDQSYRFYTIKIYLIYNDVETIIYESTLVQSITTIKFSDQSVQKFKIYNENGNTQNTGLHIIKAEAYYKLQTNM
ncbi:unnamed protein product [Paramecium pentaurelia]|uniref:Uncharacterized protein n=1 Tax=Paramecium pentaurelia TaxID=43138 RepID=A0A8S1XJR1_9CILI|nr:unnamed protein product [Paramecium pentaurelia]